MTEQRISGMPKELAAVHPTGVTRPFWDAASEGRLAVQQCRQCGEFRSPPTAFCTQCGSGDTEWVTLPGTGSVFTYTVVRHAMMPALRDSVPYVLALVDLDGAPGARLVANILLDDVDSVTVGLPVRVAFERMSDVATIPRFVPA